MSTACLNGRRNVMHFVVPICLVITNCHDNCYFCLTKPYKSQSSYPSCCQTALKSELCEGKLYFNQNRLKTKVLLISQMWCRKRKIVHVFNLSQVVLNDGSRFGINKRKSRIIYFRHQEWNILHSNRKFNIFFVAM